MIEENNYTISASGAIFCTDEKSVVASILEGWFEKRENYRSLKKKAGKDKDWVKYNSYDLFQFSFKILQNALYLLYAIIPVIAYNKSSACFDITCVETTIIPARKSSVVPNGLNLSIDECERYWMQIQLRSSKGFKYDLIPHYGCVDPGYTGDLGIKIYNVGDVDVTIEKGERYAQVAVLEKPKYKIVELDDDEYETFKGLQQRGDKGFGSSGR